jgi:hypothetical protein
MSTIRVLSRKILFNRAGALIVALVLTMCVQFPPERAAASGQHSLPTWFTLSTMPADITFNEIQPIVVTIPIITATGDFNGDGITDFLITYPRPAIDTIPPLTKAGIIFGNRNLTTPVAIDLATTPPDLALTFPANFSLGVPVDVSSVGDLNGDGIADLVVTTLVQTGTPIEGSVTGYYVFFGSADLKPGTLDFGGITPDVTIATPRNSAYAANGSAAIGDVNGDGIPDLVFISPVPPPGKGSRAAISLGPFTRGRTVDLQSGPADAYVSGIQPLRLADVNGDGVADVLVGDGTGALNTFMGSASLKGGIQVSNPDARIVGQKDEYLTSSVATGDVNGDGIADIILGSLASVIPKAGASDGEVYVIFGSRDLAGRTIDVAKNEQDVTITPPPHSLGGGLSYGQGWVAAGDVNGDGIGDIIVGAYNADGPSKRQSRAGAIYLVFGSKGLARGATVDIAKYQQDASIFGPGPNQALGYQLIGVGDFDGSGVQGLVAASGVGLTYVFFGGPLRPPIVTGAVFKKAARQLLILGTDLAGADEVEINGSIVAGAAFIPSTAEVSLAGGRQQLNLRPGDNQVVVIRKGTRSNSFTLVL